jgi:predicted RNA-binding Zn-ribbon protein involved in translation (DUF1610 family)
MDLSVAAVLVLGGLVLVRWCLVLFGATLILRTVRECPACFQGTVRLQRPVLCRLLPMADWRWCPACGWQGPSLKAPDREASSWT